MARRFRSTLAAAALLAVGVIPIAASAGGESVATTCPAYPAHLRAARNYLSRGQRDNAIAELRRANEALASCLREEAAGGSLFAGQESRRRSS